MSKEIIKTVRDTESRINSIKEEAVTLKDEVVTRKNEEVAKFKSELVSSLAQFETERTQSNAAKVETASGKIDDEVKEYGNRLNEVYENTKNQLIELGLREVLDEYGNFSHEESNVYR